MSDLPRQHARQAADPGAGRFSAAPPMSSSEERVAQRAAARVEALPSLRTAAEWAASIMHIYMMSNHHT